MIQPRNPDSDDVPVVTMPTMALAAAPKPPPPERMAAASPEPGPTMAAEVEAAGEPSTDTFGTVSRGFKTGELILKRYRVDSVLGQGGMGIVYKCVDTHTDLFVAVKTLPPALSANPEEMEEIKDNYKLVERLHHPHIADAKNIERDEATGQYFLIMEYVDGINLRQYRKKNNNSMTIQEIIPIARMIASALDFGHSEQIIHRDIKPSNIMITSQGKVKLLDYGIASQYHESMSRVTQQKYKNSGTGPYMAPEQWTADYQDAKTDQYALAVVIYEMLTGSPPFMNPDPVILGQMVRKEPPRKPENISAQTWAVLSRALAKKRKDRFDTCSEFVAALDDSLNGLQSEASRHKARVGIYITAAVLVLMLVLGFLQRSAQNARIETNRRNALALVERAGQLAANGVLGEAEDLLLRALAASPGLPDAEELLARIADRGTLNLTSQPPGAEVWLRDRSLGTTPLLIERLPGETLPLVFKLPGYEPVARTLTVAPREETSFRAELVGNASLLVRSTPPGARVSVNGEAKGQTPLELKRLSPGPLVVALALDGYRPVEKTVEVREGSAPLEVTLEKSAATLVVDTTPSGATVEVAGQTKTSPATFEGLPPGSHEIRVSLAGHQPRTATITLADGQTLRQPFILAALAEPSIPVPTPGAQTATVAPLPTPPPAVVAVPAPEKAAIVVVPALYAQGVRSTFWREFLEKINVADPASLENPEFSARLIDRLIQTRKFDVLERENLRDVIKELKWGDSDWADPAKVAKIGRQQNAHYVVIPVIQNVMFDVERREIPYVGTTKTTLKGHLEAQIRIVETATGRIAASQFLTQEHAVELPDADKEFERRKVLARFVPDLYDAFALNATARITDEIYPIRVMVVDGAQVTLNRGEGAILVGETLEVFSRGQALIDPDTREALGFHDTQVGKVVVEKVLPKISIARVVDGAIQVDQVCRRTHAPVPTPTPRPVPRMNW